MTRACAVAVLATLLVAGCGGGRSGRLSHADFVKRADALCHQSVVELKRLKNPTSLVELVAYLKKARPIETRFLAEARKLKPPVKDEADWSRALAFDEKVVSYYDAMAAAAKRNDRAALRRISAKLQALPAKNPYEQRLGMRGC